MVRGEQKLTKDISPINQMERVAMSVSLNPLCWFNRHVPDRDAVHWDSHHYIGTCRRCGAPIRRLERKQWRKEWKQGGT